MDRQPSRARRKPTRRPTKRASSQASNQASSQKGSRAIWLTMAIAALGVALVGINLWRTLAPGTPAGKDVASSTEVRVVNDQQSQDTNGADNTAQVTSSASQDATQGKDGDKDTSGQGNGSGSSTSGSTGGGNASSGGSGGYGAGVTGGAGGSGGDLGSMTDGSAGSTSTGGASGSSGGGGQSSEGGAIPEGSASSWQTSYEANQYQQAVVDYTRSTPATERGLGAQWVEDVFSKAGYGTYYGNASDLIKAFGKFEGSDPLMVGMIIGTLSHTHTPEGEAWGHVGIYIGDGEVMHCEDGVVSTMTCEEYFNYYGATSPLKWGWLGDHALA